MHAAPKSQATVAIAVFYITIVSAAPVRYSGASGQVDDSYQTCGTTSASSMVYSAVNSSSLLEEVDIRLKYCVLPLGRREGVK
jgi:hypothetical protein